eukprot:gnl/MRDRNA2_/MRDRNA2_113698_c0_seq1.p1 gnl/MRDRNA2_/MRDRNA2_113698_c0~~gnl/MRDRNA2_/MRDRNA2_113698_c0_seq1.p1  ORF type:complete len:588 (+),score=66.40 gnl/MRDRNA2_/MRDRNA2_113698_c0_seq1:120-1883(+)
MPFLRLACLVVFTQFCKCIATVPQGPATSSKHDRRHPNPATEECSSLLQVDMTRTSQMPVHMSADTVQAAEAEANNPTGQSGPHQLDNETQSQDGPNALLVTHDSMKRTVTDMIQSRALHTDKTVKSELDQEATGMLNSTSTGQAQADLLQKPYLELHIYFDLLLGVLALLVFFLLPQALGGHSEEAPDGRGNLPPFLPALSSLRYLAMVTVWLKHRWFSQLFDTSEFVLVLSGFVLEYAEQRKSEGANVSLSYKYHEFLPRRFARLYPLFALHIIIGLLSASATSTCDPVRALLLYQSWGYGTGTFMGGKLVYNSCGIGTWFVSVIFGCYFLFPILSRPMRHLPSGALPILWVGCTIFIMIPRALAAPAGNHNVWWDDVFHQQGTAVGLMELLISKKSLLHGLAHFFLGMVLARSWVASSLLEMSGSDERPSLTSKVITYGCSLGAILLGALWFTVLKHPNMMRNSYGLRLLSEAWKVSCQSAVMLGAAGPCTSGSLDPARALLRMPWLVWLGELALPLYLTVSWACDFSDKLMLSMGVSQKGSSISEVSYFVSQLVVTHGIALTIYQSCGALTSRVANAGVKEAA